MYAGRLHHTLEVESMMGRAEVVDVLLSEGVTEAVAWRIVIRMSPHYLENADATAVRDSVDNMIWEHLERTGQLDYAIPL